MPKSINLLSPQRPTACQHATCNKPHPPQAYRAKTTGGRARYILTANLRIIPFATTYPMKKISPEIIPEINAAKKHNKWYIFQIINCHLKIVYYLCSRIYKYIKNGDSKNSK